MSSPHALDSPEATTKPLTPKQLAFVAAFVKGSSAQAAALEAGYSKGSARSKAHTWLRQPRFVAAVTAMQAEKLRADIADADELRRQWTTILRDPRQVTRDRLKAAELLGKSMGLFLEKVEHSGGVEVAHRIGIYFPDNGRGPVIEGKYVRLVERSEAIPAPPPSAPAAAIDAEPPESPQEPASAGPVREQADGVEEAPAPAREAGEGFEHYFRHHPAAGLRLV
jgi:hypothetical protein